MLLSKWGYADLGKIASTSLCGHLGLSIRAWQRLLKVARTIADIDQSDIITRQHLQEAVSYRAIDRLLIHLQKLLT